MPIREEAARRLAHELVEALGIKWASPSTEETIARFITNSVKVDELNVQIEQKESVIKLLGGTNGN